MLCFVVLFVLFISNYVGHVSKHFRAQHGRYFQKRLWNPFFVYYQQLRFITRYNKFLEHFNILVATNLKLLYSSCIYYCIAGNAYVCYRFLFVNKSLFENVCVVLGFITTSLIVRILLNAAVNVSKSFYGIRKYLPKMIFSLEFRNLVSKLKLLNFYEMLLASRFIGMKVFPQYNVNAKFILRVVSLYVIFLSMAFKQMNRNRLLQTSHYKDPIFF